MRVIDSVGIEPTLAEPWFIQFLNSRSFLAIVSDLWVLVFVISRLIVPVSFVFP